MGTKYHLKSGELLEAGHLRGAVSAEACGGGGGPGAGASAQKKSMYQGAHLGTPGGDKEAGTRPQANLA